MKRYLVVTVGYNYLAIPMGPEVTPVLAALAEAVPVESKGYGDELRWVPTTTEPVNMQFVNANKFTIGDELETLRVKLKEAEGQALSYSKYWTAEQTKVAELKKELAATKGAPAPLAKDVSEEDPL